MTNINELAKQTLFLLGQRGLKPTPENYTEVFEELSSKRGVSGGTKEKVEKFKALLIPAHQNDIQLKNIKNIDELLFFLISKINRQNKEKSPQLFELLNIIMKSLLASKDKKVKDIASMTLARISKAMDLENIYLLEKKWQQWQQDYEDHELEEELKKYGIKNDDFTLTIKKLLSQLKARSYDRFAKLIALCLHPSLLHNDKIAEFEQKLKEKPYILALDQGKSDTFKNELLEMVNKRISTDLIFVQQNLNFFDQNLQKLNQLIDLLNNINQNNVAFVNSLQKEQDGSVKVSFDDLKNKFLALNEKITHIHTHLHKVSDTKQRENWTLQKHILKLDEVFLQYKINYALCVFSVSNYRFIMEKYGVSNLSEILERFKKILQENCDENDELWMLDEKSYLLIVCAKTYEQIIPFMQKNINEIENFKFIYKQDVIIPSIVSFFMDKASYPHLNLLDELLKKVDEI
ncbi:hypothetical protein [Campylobacter sp. MIT 97-5078]|uniref:hypothetical protein n=1 Tax=Campylobacter sp. MIT 97-5078 TaxID=1548153 RepID=UPI000512E738|nr:hypothetical protein [Campylobacter sp. MIT 97-5078]KGI56366.1 hypothetical protein LR59_07545 [Campylobacter sp. MIT 97-5078]KGI56870.1 hypothetical protein LR59_05210 [Campylobacter sp. MIT 97-5078]KGI56919.1 hypothetical protein LR59_05515 [Campylobacter sp. MIT 97-5078]TQR26704.1 hypothetical protein DMB91_06535 [Campylobacter sp. MIT 97-5078]